MDELFMRAKSKSGISWVAAKFEDLSKLLVWGSKRSVTWMMAFRSESREVAEGIAVPSPHLWVTRTERDSVMEPYASHVLGFYNALCAVLNDFKKRFNSLNEKWNACFVSVCDT